MKTLVLILFAAALVGKSAAQQPDTLFVNGKIYVGARDGKPLAMVQALAVQNGRVIAVGSDADIRKLKGTSTAVVDLGGRFVMPGFNDAHCHLLSGGMTKLNVDLEGTRNLDEMKSRIRERAQSTPAGEWIVGRGWDHTKWTEVKLPTRQDLDAVTGDHPAYFTRVDGHILIANTAALKLAGITAKIAVPEGGKIDFDVQGEPTGIIRETAMGLIHQLVPRNSPARYRRAAELALEDAARYGVTSAQDNSDWDAFLVYEDLQREGKLTLRITEWLPFDAPLATLQKRRQHHSPTDLMLHTGLLKGFMDGSLGSRTAAMLAPYNDEEGNSGLPRYEQAHLNQLVIERARAGFHFGFHAIGDRAVEMALQAFEAAAHDQQERGESQADNRFRVEHVQVVAPDHYARFKKSGVIASMQANHLLTDMNWAMDRLGAERARRSYDWAGFRRAGVRLAFGTDYPVEPITPFRGLYAAVTRINEEATKTYPGEAMSIHEAISAYTSDAAYAEFAEREKGTLEKGMLADFIVLDRDLTTAAPPAILKTKVLRTVVNGKTVYESK